MTFADVLNRLFLEQHTGPVTVHFAEGCPTNVEIPATPTRLKLDKRGRPDRVLTASVESAPLRTRATTS
jgi:hypothetical protein